MKRILGKPKIEVCTLGFEYWYNYKLFHFHDKTDSYNNINYKRKKSINKFIKFGIIFFDVIDMYGIILTFRS